MLGPTGRNFAAGYERRLRVRRPTPEGTFGSRVNLTMLDQLEEPVEEDAMQRSPFGDRRASAWSRERSSRFDKSGRRSGDIALTR